MPDEGLGEGAVADAIAVYSEYLARLEQGAEPDLDALCTAHPELADELRELDADRLEFEALGMRLETLELEPAAPAAASESDVVPLDRISMEEALIELRARTPRLWPFDPRGEIGRGTFGIVEEVSESGLRRRVAKKTLRAPSGGSPRDTQERHADRFRRFLEEAQVLAQLNHPGIVTVHAIGVDPEGSPYFTMQLVKGEDFANVIEDVRAGREGWTLHRALDVIVKVCDALAYAHSRGVIHRDLKPVHLRVGRFGETYILDWGLARVLNRPDPRGLRTRLPEEAERSTSAQDNQTVIETDRKAQGDSDSSLRTQDGTALGTPSYMSPEQARGDLEAVGAQSDIYSVGAILYQLLVGHPPYTNRESTLDARVVHALVLNGPPRPVHELAPEVPVELVSICEKAMERDTARRYQRMEVLAEDLRAYLEGRVVRAYETGALAEFKKWVRRNRRVALLTGGALLTAMLALFVTALVYQQSRAHLIEKDRIVGRLTDATILDNLAERIEGLGAALPANEEAYAKVINDLGAVLEHEQDHRATLEEIRAAGTLAADGSTLVFSNDFESFSFGVLERIISDLEEIREPERGTLAQLEGQLLFLRDVKARTLEDTAVAQRWALARQSIEASERYDGLELAQQIGLVPLRADPDSGLWEFWHVGSGSEPQVGDDGDYVLTEGTGVVLVLVPGGQVHVGAQKVDPDWPNYDEGAESDESFEGRPFRVDLEAYFLAKYELNQAQWIRMGGVNKSSRTRPLLNPVEMVTWIDARRVLQTWDLNLPTEAQWERAMRGGTETPYPLEFVELSELAKYSNSADQTYEKIVQEGWFIDPELNDGFAKSAPVGSLDPGPFGFFDGMGNVYEWCADWYRKDDAPPRAGDGRRPDLEQGPPQRAVRGGCWYFPVRFARPANRFKFVQNTSNPFTGVRPARPVRGI